MSAPAEVEKAVHRIDHSVLLPHLRSLTGLRWVAAVVVFGYHLVSVEYVAGEGELGARLLFGAGSSGVSLFFMLSGFVLAWGARPGDHPARFWLRRAARIWPLHLITVALALVLAATLIPWIRTSDPLSVVADVFLVNSWRPEWWQAGNPVSWSLACEMFFYLLFPLVIRGLGRLSTNGLVAVGILMLCVLGIVPLFAEAFSWPFTPYSWPPFRLPEFVIGIVLARLVRFGAWRGPRLAPAVAFAIFGYLYAAALTLPGAIASPAASTLVSDVGFGLVIAALARRDLDGSGSALASPVMVKLGQASFAFYLVHLLVIQVEASSWPVGHPHLDWLPAIGLGLVAFVAALGIALALHEFVEKRAQRYLLSLPLSRSRRKPS